MASFLWVMFSFMFHLILTRLLVKIAYSGLGDIIYRDMGTLSSEASSIYVVHAHQ